MSSEKGQKHIYAQEHQLYYYYNNFRGHSEKEWKTGVYFTVVSLFETIHCRISFKLQQNTAKFVERVLLLSFPRENIRILWAAKTWSLASVKINCASAKLSRFRSTKTNCLDLFTFTSPPAMELLQALFPPSYTSFCKSFSLASWNYWEFASSLGFSAIL